MYKMMFLHMTHPFKLGVRLIHKARNLGCFTSSPQATQRYYFQSNGKKRGKNQGHIYYPEITVPSTVYKEGFKEGAIFRVVEIKEGND